ncbi:MAG: RNA methyltransferase [Verrucomicrobiota bacterium]|nr:RNA methyltransferase [Verrucomicrobiota bacterium]
MFRLRHIDSLHLPELEPYRSMSWQQEHRKRGIFVSEGEKVVRRLLESDLTIHSLLIPKDLLPDFEPALQRRPEMVEVYLAKKALLEELTGFNLYQGVLGLAQVPATATLPEILTIIPQPFLITVIEGVSNAENMGALIRNCAAFGVKAVCITPGSCSPYLRRAVRNSMGAIFKMKVVEATDVIATLRVLKSHEIQTVAAHPHATGPALSGIDFRRSTCLVFGSEGHGLEAQTLAACDLAVAIPMQQEIDSLNVGTSAAVFLYEVARQRGLA